MARFRLIAISVFLTATVTLGNEVLEVKEKSVKGAILGLNSQNEKVRSESIKTLTRLTDDVWDLMRNPCDSGGIAADARFRDEAKPVVGHLITALKSGDPEIVSTAAMVLAKLGPDGRTSLPTLRKLFQHRKVPTEATSYVFIALLHVTPKEKPLGPTLLQYLRSLPKQQRVELDKLSKEIENSSPFLASKETKGTIDNMSIILWRMCVNADRTTVEVPHLVKTAASPKYRLAVRTICIGILAEFAWDAESAVPGLRALLRDKEKFIRVSAALALVRIQKQPALVPPLLKALRLTREEQAAFRQIVDPPLKEEQRQIEKLRSAGPEIIRDLVNVAKCENGFYRRSAIIALGRIGPAAKAAIPALEHALKHSDRDTRNRAAEALSQIDP